MAGKRKAPPKADPDDTPPITIPNLGPRELEQWIAGLTDKEARIEVVLDMMCRGRWVTGTSALALARLWQVGFKTVCGYADEANRVFKRMYRESPEAREEKLARSLQAFEQIAADARKFRSPNGLRVALEAIKADLDYSGMGPVKKHEVKDTTDPFKDWTEEQIAHFADTGERPKAGDGGE